MLSSIVFHHTLRDSAALFEGIEFSNDKKVFASADCNALRLWSCTKQIKASHMTGGFELLTLEHLEYFDCFLFVYYLRDSKVGYAEIRDSDLKRKQRIKLGSMNSKSFCVVSPDKSYFIMTDNDENMNFFNITATKKVKPKEGPWFPRASDFMKIGKTVEYFPSLQIRKVQTITKTSLEYSGIQVIHIFNENCFCFIASRVMYVFKRLKAKAPFAVAVEALSESDVQKTKRPKSRESPLLQSARTEFEDEEWEDEEWEEEGEEDEDGAQSPKRSEEFVTPEQFSEDYNFTLLQKIDSLFHGHGAPVSVSRMGTLCNFLCVAFSNGYIGVYECGNMFSRHCYRPPNDSFDVDSRDSDEFDGDPPTPVVFFKAHSPLNNSPYLSAQVEASPWQTVPGELYVLEFFSIGSDYKLCHWGLRRRLDNPTIVDSEEDGNPPLSAPSLRKPTRNLMKYSYEIDLMGVIIFYLFLDA